VLETQGDISDISGIVSKEVTIGMDWVLLVIVIMLCGLVVMVIE
jgi:hypothetical protein